MVPCLTTHLIASLSFRGHLALPPRAGGRDFRASLGAGLSSGGCRVNGLGRSWFARWAGQALLTAVRGALAPGHLGLFSQGCTWSQGPRRPDLKFVTLLPQCQGSPTGTVWGNKKWELPRCSQGSAVSEWVSEEQGFRMRRILGAPGRGWEPPRGSPGVSMGNEQLPQKTA